jgi:uncharacterized protein
MKPPLWRLHNTLALMPLSRYLKTWPCYDKEDHFILYSTKKGAVTRVSSALLSAAKSGALTDAARETLTRLEIWCEDLAAERRTMHDILTVSNGKKNKFHAQLVLNLDCNLACTYCYEEPFRHKQHMTDEVASQAVALLSGHLASGLDLEVDFYGGEPLLSVPLLKRIAAQLKPVAAEHGRSFSFFLFTNGTLLTRKLVEELLPFGLTGALVTLDGTREIHDRQRPFVSGKGSFDLIVANIRDVCQLINIDLGGNYNQETFRQFPQLLDYLVESGITPDRISNVQFSPISAKSTSSHDGFASCATADASCVQAAVPFLRREIKRRGFAQPKPKIGACMVEFSNFLVINHDGAFYKCPTFMGWPELSVGSLADGIIDYRDSHKLLFWQNDECLDCAYLPLCFGGCRLNPLLKNGSINELDCRREFFDATLEQLVRQNLSSK